MDKRTILLVEDNEDQVLLTIQALEDNGVDAEVVVAQDGQEALDYLRGAGGHSGRDPAELPSLVILDLNLPLLNGHEVLAGMRRDPRTRLVPVVILTSSMQENDIVAGYGNGANSYVQKPVRYHDLSEAVRQIASYWLSLNIAPERPHHA